MRKIICFILVTTLLLTLASCGKAHDFRNDYDCAELLAKALEKTSVASDHKALGAEHIKYNFNSTTLDDDHAFLASTPSTDISEVGVFHAPNRAIREELSELVEEYLEDYLEEKEAFIASYAPQELEKLKMAETRVFGNYVVYAILSGDDSKIFFDTVEKLLSE